jgi:hypothetical protein
LVFGEARAEFVVDQPGSLGRGSVGHLPQRADHVPEAGDMECRAEVDHLVGNDRSGQHGLARGQVDDTAPRVSYREHIAYRQRAVGQVQGAIDRAGRVRAGVTSDVHPVVVAERGEHR